jgi:methylenetetrahydrofolate dehydrogenase (NADP+) / methenyltetrahydrofolate cyclohydrolase
LQGCIELLKRHSIPISGKQAVVLGRSNIVGIPAALLLLEQNATVTVCHSRTADIAEQVKRADIVVAAIGKPEFVKGDWIKPGATVIDVGINSVGAFRVCFVGLHRASMSSADDPTTKRGYRLVGDVDFAEASKHAGAITPVPGGVGPMTIAMLLQNTVEAAESAARS